MYSSERRQLEDRIERLQIKRNTTPMSQRERARIDEEVAGLKDRLYFIEGCGCY